MYEFDECLVNLGDDEEGRPSLIPTSICSPSPRSHAYVLHAMHRSHAYVILYDQLSVID